MKTFAAAPVLSLLCFLLSGMAALGQKTVEPVTGTYKDALRKAGEAGKPLMLDFYSDSHIDCKRQYEQMQQIPDTMKKFVYYRIDGEKNQALVKQFQVDFFPTVILLKPNGSEFYRWDGRLVTPIDLQDRLEKQLLEAGPIAKSQKHREPPLDKTTKGVAERAAYETAAGHEMKAAMNQLAVGRKTDAIKAFKQIIAKYPDSEAAKQAQEKLDELEPVEIGKEK